MGGRIGKNYVNAKQTTYFENMLKYETDKLKTNPTASFAKSTATNATQTIIDAKLTVMH